MLKESNAAHRALLRASGLPVNGSGAASASASAAAKRETTTARRFAGAKRRRGGVKAEDDAVLAPPPKRERSTAAPHAPSASARAVDMHSKQPDGDGDGEADDSGGGARVADLAGLEARALERAQRRINESYEVHCDLTADDNTTVWTEKFIDPKARKQQRDAQALPID